MTHVMRALTLPPAGGGAMGLAEIAVPRPKPGQILVQMKVSAVNEMDVQVRSGGWASQVKAFRRAGPVVTGFEFVGVAHSDGRRIRSGDRVIGYSHVLNGPRTHADYACIDENDLQAVPAGLGDEDAAALVVMGLTAVEILERLKPPRPGQKCLVIGAAGGVGIYSVQLASSQGAEVSAVCLAANGEWVRAQGASQIRPYESEPFYRSGDRFDLVIDTPAKSSFREAAPYLAPGGMYVTTNPTADLGGFVRAAFSSKRAGYLMMLRSNPAKLARLIELHATGAVRAAVDSVHDLAEANAAFDRFAVRGKQGRVLLRINP